MITVKVFIQDNPEYFFFGKKKKCGHKPNRAALASKANDDDPSFISDSTYIKRIVKI